MPNAVKCLLSMVGAFRVSRWVYQASYTLAMALPGKTRGKRKRAERFADWVVEAVQPHTPLTIAITLNALVVLSLCILPRVRTGGAPASISLSIGADGFFTESPTAEPPSGVGGCATATDNVLAEINPTLSPTSAPAVSADMMSAITMVAPSSITLPKSIAQPKALNQAAMAVLTAEASGLCVPGGERHIGGSLLSPVRGSASFLLVSLDSPPFQGGGLLGFSFLDYPSGR